MQSSHLWPLESLVYTQNLLYEADEFAINYIEKYCENEQDLHVLAFTKKVRLEKEIKLKPLSHLVGTSRNQAEPAGIKVLLDSC